MKYILHDTNTMDDEGVASLFIKFGYEGTGLFWAILEKLGKQEKPIKTEVLKKQLGVGKKLERVWIYMEEIGLISSSNGDTFNNKVLNFSEKYQIRSEKNRIKVKEWREKQKFTENVTSNELIRNGHKVKLSKVNKEKDKKEGQDSSFSEPIKKGKVTSLDGIQIPDEWRPALNYWIEYKNERKEYYSGPKGVNGALSNIKKLCNNDPTKSMELVEAICGKNWQGIYWPFGGTVGVWPDKPKSTEKIVSPSLRPYTEQ